LQARDLTVHALGIKKDITTEGGINGQEKINAWLQRELIKSSTMMCFTQQFISRE
jgi:hypothetical protein